MKLNNAQRNVKSSGMSVHVDFSIDMNSKAFSVLSDGMYSDIIPSIVRELSSNCYDAHVAANKADTPFEVYVPTAFDPHFAVKDFGTGLSYYKYTGKVSNKLDGESTVTIKGDIRPEIGNIGMIVIGETATAKIGNVLYDTSSDETVLRIPGNWDEGDVTIEFDDTLVLYSTYFRSTKEQSNDFIGAFGLGSKTPLAYTDNFMVINRFNGVLRVYNILTNENGQPQINVMSSSTTDDGNGLEVRLAVDPDDYGSFKDAITDQLKYFSPHPTVFNDVVEFPNIVYTGKTFFMTDKPHKTYSSYYNRVAQACVGNNAYSIKHVESDLFAAKLVLRFGVGEVGVTSSREDLKYDDKTIELIALREKEAIAEYTKYVLDSIDGDGMTDYEKAAFLNNNSAAIDLSLPTVKEKVGNPHYTYHKNSIVIPISGWGDYNKVEFVTKKNDAGVDVIVVEKGYRQHILDWTKYNGAGTKCHRLTGEQYIKPMSNLLVFVRDNSYSFLKKISYYLENNVVVSGDNILILDVSDVPAWKVGFDSIAELVKPHVTFVMLSSIELPKTFTMTASDRNPTPTARLFDLSNPESFESSKLWNDIYDPLTKIDTNAYIIETHMGKFTSRVSSTDVEFFINYLLADYPIDKNIAILAMSTARYSKALDYGFKPISELFANLRPNVKIPVSLVHQQVWNDELHSKLNDCNILDLIKMLPQSKTVAIPKKNPVMKLQRILKAFEKRYDSSKSYAVAKLMQGIPKADYPKPLSSMQKMIDSAIELCDNVSESMILLEGTSGYTLRHNEKMQDKLIEYITNMYQTGDNK